MPVPCLPLHPTLSAKYAAHDEPWDLYYPIDIQVISASSANEQFVRILTFRPLTRDFRFDSQREIITPCENSNNTWIYDNALL